MGGPECVEGCKDGPRAICRMLQAIIAGTALFIGIVCQFWTSGQLNEVSLVNLCMTFSGSKEVMGVQDFNALLDWYDGEVLKCPKKRGCVKFEEVSRYFMRSSGLDPNRADLMQYADASFFCKHAPNGIAARSFINPRETCLDKLLKNPLIDSYPCKLWPEQETSPTDAGNWYLANVEGTRGPMFHISCYDKVAVYKNFLEAMFGGSWKVDDIRTAADRYLQSCVIDKGGDGYMLTVGPVCALIGGIITTATMFKGFARPPWPDLGMNLLLISIILLFVGFWSIAMVTSDEVLSKYTYCGMNLPPLTYSGKWYDGTPCIDQTTDGAHESHPFVDRILFFDAVYVAGGVLSFIASLLFMGLSSGFTETMMNDRMGKYLVTLQDIPMKVRFPVPPGGLGGLGSMGFGALSEPAPAATPAAAPAATVAPVAANHAAAAATAPAATAAAASSSSPDLKAAASAETPAALPAAHP